MMATITKRTWESPDGTTKEAWQLRYLDARGERRSKQFQLRKEADAYRKKVERELHDGIHTPDGATASFAKIAEQFIGHFEQRARDGRIGPSHLERITSAIRKLMIPRFGKTKLRDIQMHEVEEWYGEMNLSVKPVTAKRNVYFLKQIEDYARARGYLKTSIVADALREMRGVRSDPIRTPTMEEMGRLLAHLMERRPYHHDRSHAFLKATVLLAVMCGLRQGEIFGLTSGNVDFDAGIIHVRHSMRRDDVLKSPKTKAGMRDVLMPDPVAAALREWLGSHYVANDRGLIFRSSSGKCIHTAAAHRPWKVFLKRAGLSDQDETLRFHALRHFHASWLIHKGLSMPDVAKALGHRHFDMTLQVYAHPVESLADRRSQVTAMIEEMPGAAATRQQHGAGYTVVNG